MRFEYSSYDIIIGLGIIIIIIGISFVLFFVSLTAIFLARPALSSLFSVLRLMILTLFCSISHCVFSRYARLSPSRNEVTMITLLLSLLSYYPEESTSFSTLLFQF